MSEIESKIELLTSNQLAMTASEFNNELMRLIKLVEEEQIDLCTGGFPVTYEPPATVHIDEDSIQKVMNAPRVSQQLTE